MATKASANAALVTEKALGARLRGMSKADIKAFAGAINRLGGGGFKPDDVFPIGIIINNPDGVEVRGHVTEADIAAIVNMISGLNPKSVTIFPRGIVVPDNFRVHVKLNGSGG